MRNINSIALVLFTVLTLALSGCGNGEYELATVSGTITFEGKPVDQVQVSFMPQPVEDEDVHNVGPYSKGDSDLEGKFSLKTRYDETGAVVGKHKLIFKYIGVDSLSELSADLDDAKDSGSRELVQEVRKRIADASARLKQRPVSVVALAGCTTIIDAVSYTHLTLPTILLV